MTLWWPSSQEEIDFLKEKHQLTDQVHVGYQYISATEGAIHSDGSFGLGLLNKATDGLNIPDGTFLISEESCLTYNFGQGQFVFHQPCPQKKSLCSTRLGEDHFVFFKEYFIP